MLVARPSDSTCMFIIGSMSSCKPDEGQYANGFCIHRLDYGVRPHRRSRENIHSGSMKWDIALAIFISKHRGTRGSMKKRRRKSNQYQTTKQRDIVWCGCGHILDKPHHLVLELSAKVESLNIFWPVAEGFLVSWSKICKHVGCHEQHWRHVY
jgi:hypothetical protein